MSSPDPRSRAHAWTGDGKRVAVMQPYFFPYAGYFRLFSQVDEFVIYDCVQFPRRGRVHRSELAGGDRRLKWLQLPLAQQPMDVLIHDLAFATDARAEFDRRIERLPWIATSNGPAADRLRTFLDAPLTSVIDYLEQGLRLVNDLLGIDTTITRSSALGLDRSLRGQQRVLAVLESRGASHYLNSPGGRDLYDYATFDQAGIKLEFLPAYQGQYFNLLQALMTVDPQRIRDDIDRNGVPA